MAEASISTYAVLGLLSLAPMSGYDTALAVEHSIAYFWPLSKTHVYSELARIESLGWAEARDVRQETLPDKRVYRITRDGERALDDWLVSGTLPAEVHRLPLLIKLFVGHRIPRNRLRDILRSYREEAEEYRTRLEGIVHSLDQIPKAAFPRSTALLGLRATEATLRWLDEIEEALLARRVVIDPRTDADAARKLLEATPPRPRPRRRR